MSFRFHGLSGTSLENADAHGHTISAHMKINLPCLLPCLLTCFLYSLLFSASLKQDFFFLLCWHKLLSKKKTAASFLRSFMSFHEVFKGTTATE